MFDMPWYYSFQIAGHYLYFSSSYLIEAESVHVDDGESAEVASALFHVYADGTSVLEKRGNLKDEEIPAIRKFIKENYLDMYKTWKNFSVGGDFYSKW